MGEKWGEVGKATIELESEIIISKDELKNLEIAGFPDDVLDLVQYIGSLEKMKSYSVDFRKIEGNLNHRVDELIAHHHVRLIEVESIIADAPGITGHDITSKMKWSIRTVNWQTFPPEQKWFAIA